MGLTRGGTQDVVPKEPINWISRLSAYKSADDKRGLFETVFTIGSVHKGTIIEINKKQAVVTLPYGVEGTVALKNIVK